jgi:hypothetical protein
MELIKVNVTRALGIYEVGKCYEIENDITANFLLNNGFANEVDINNECKDCNEKLKAKVEPVEIKKETKK